uniref:Uncharacterized protein n=1 Tax=Glossina brevipalpis TaxID=37001 RepID=A0A1A9X4N2_9MUSC
MVVVESMVSGHKFNTVRERLGDKVETIRFDPYIQMEAVYRERKKIRSINLTKVPLNKEDHRGPKFFKLILLLLGTTVYVNSLSDIIREERYQVWVILNQKFRTETILEKILLGMNSTQ